MNGRDKCELLNQIRQKIADENDIDFKIYECTYEGDCTGTCPKCESELKYLEAELAKNKPEEKRLNLMESSHWNLKMRNLLIVSVGMMNH